MTTARFMRFSPAPIRPRSPAVPKDRGPRKRSSSSGRAFFSIKEDSSVRGAGSGSPSRNARARSRTEDTEGGLLSSASRVQRDSRALRITLQAGEDLGHHRRALELHLARAFARALKRSGGGEARGH